LVRRSDGLHIAVARQRKDASPCQGEAGAQRRVRVDPVVVRPLRVHVVCDPAPCLAAAIPSQWIGVRRARTMVSQKATLLASVQRIPWATQWVAPVPMGYKVKARPHEARAYLEFLDTGDVARCSGEWGSKRSRQTVV